MSHTTDTWFEIQYSVHNEDDWYCSNITADTITSARSELKKAALNGAKGIDFRIVKVNMTKESIEESSKK